VSDPNWNAFESPTAGNITLDSYVNRALVSQVSGYGPNEAPIVNPNSPEGVSDASEAITITLRDPETMLPAEAVGPDGGVEPFVGESPPAPSYPQDNLTTTEFNAEGSPVKVTDPMGRVTTYLYNGYDEVAESTDPTGGVTDYSYTTKGDPSTVTDPLGQTTSYDDESDGQVCEVLSPLAAEKGDELPGMCDYAAGPAGLTSIGFDDYGDITEVEDPDQHVTSYAFDADGETCAEIAPNGWTGTLISSCPGDSGDSFGGEWETIYPMYDVFGDVLRTIKPAQTSGQNGTIWLEYYDADGHETETVTPESHATNYTYDPDGDETSVENADGDTTTYTYTPDGQLFSTVSPDGDVTDGTPNDYRTINSIDDLGRVNATLDPNGDSGSGDDESCNPGTSSSPCAWFTYYDYDAAGNTIEKTAPLATSPSYAGVQTQNTYDADSELTETEVVDPSTSSLVSEETYGYNADGEETSSVAPDGYESGQSYGNWTTTQSFDADGQLTSVTQPAGDGVDAGTTWYFYDQNGNRIAVTNAEGDGTSCTPTQPSSSDCSYTTYYSYDVANRLTQVTPPVGEDDEWEGQSGYPTVYTYDADGDVLSASPASYSSSAFPTIDYAYDGADELTSVCYEPDGTNSDPPPAWTSCGSDPAPETSYTYNSDGTRATMTAGGNSYTYSYDDASQLHIVDELGSSISYGYDADGNVHELTYPGTSDLQVTDDYNPDDSLLSVAWTETVDDVSSDTTASYQENEADEKTQLQLSGTVGGVSDAEVTTDDGYDDGGRLADIDTTSSTETAPLLNLEYDDSGLYIDADGDPTGEEVAVNSNSPNEPTSYYDYDYVQRANYDSTTAPSSEPVASGDQTYTYDSAGWVTQGSAVAVDDYYQDGEIETATTVGGDPSAVTLSYDDEGDRIGESTPSTTTTYAFDSAGQMCWSAATTSLPAGGSQPDCGSPASGATTYTYDGDGLRSSETTGGTTTDFYWDTVSSVPELLAAGSTDYIYGLGNTPIAQVNGAGTIDELLSDRDGSVREVVSPSTGDSVAYTGYDVYGNPTSNSVDGYTPFGFQGGYTDPTGLVYYQQRYYDPGTGQFMSVDPLNELTNAGYSFVEDNPLDGTDPTGQQIHQEPGGNGGEGGDCGSQCATEVEESESSSNVSQSTAAQSTDSGPQAVAPGSGLDDCPGRVMAMSGCPAQIEASIQLEGPMSWEDWVMIGASFLPLGDAVDGVITFIRGGSAVVDVVGDGATAAEGGADGIDAFDLKMSSTVEQHISDLAKDGSLARPYADSRLTIQNIMDAGTPVPDPGGVPGALRWDVPGALNGSSGTWELVVDPQTNTILHFLFKSG
jgi:RHS repeat-associated protein